MNSQDTDIYEDCSQNDAEDLTELKDGLINDSTETESIDAAQGKIIGRKDHIKVIKTQESKIPLSIKTKSSFLGYPLPPGYNAKEMQEKFKAG